MLRALISLIMHMMLSNLPKVTELISIDSEAQILNKNLESEFSESRLPDTKDTPAKL